MSFDWADYLALAKRLHNDGIHPPLEEAKLRAAISRAYYAAFCAARNFLRAEQKVIIPKTGEAHGVVRRAYESDTDGRRKHIGMQLGRMHNNRAKADYDDTVQDLPRLAQATIIIADQVMQKLSQL